jgi:hypothetical protein
MPRLPAALTIEAISQIGTMSKSQLCASVNHNGSVVDIPGIILRMFWPVAARRLLDQTGLDSSGGNECVQ